MAMWSLILNLKSQLNTSAGNRALTDFRPCHPKGRVCKDGATRPCWCHLAQVSDWCPLPGPFCLECQSPPHVS